MHSFESIFPKFSRHVIPPQYDSRFKNKHFKFLWQKNGSNIHNFGFILLNFLWGMSPEPLYDSRFKNKSVQFACQKRLSRAHFWVHFPIVFHAGIPPDLPSMTRGLQTFLSIMVRKALKTIIFNPFFQHFLGVCPWNSCKSQGLQTKVLSFL